MGPITDYMVTRMLRRKLDSNKVTLLHWETHATESFQSVNSGTIRFFVKYQFQGEKFEEWFFVKLPILIRGMYDFNCLIGVLENELITYELILPQIHRVMDKHFAPKLFYSVKTDYTLILEDLISKGYQALPQKYQFDLKPTLQILQEMAQFHAASVQVHEIRGDVYDWLNLKYLTNLPGYAEDNAEKLGNLFMKLVRRVNSKFAVENAEKLEDFKNTILPLSCSQTVCNENAFNVLNHGDFWTTNLMLKYDDQDNIEDIKFVDFQYAVWNTPAFDFIIFLMTSVKFDVFKNHADKLYGSYVNTFNDSLKKLGIDKSYTTEELVEDIENKYCWWLYFIIIRMQATFCDSNIFERKMLIEGQFMDGEWYKSVADKWMSYFIEKSIESPENGMLSKWY